MTKHYNYFHWVDYLVLGATLLGSALIGVYHAFNKGGQHTTKDFLLGGRKMPVIPTGLSLLVSFLSGILILGHSSEMYTKGTNFVWFLIGVLVGIPLAALIYQPVFYHLQLTSAYEYLELRFKSKLVRLIGSVLFISSTLMYMAIVMYAPATALNGVSGINLELLIALSGVICTFYTAMGGLKAVVWTDAFQAVMMYAGLIAVLVQGTIVVGGPAKVWDIAWDGGRIITDWNPYPFSYMNFWGVVFGTALGWMSVYGTNQTAVQRYTSLSSLKKAQISLMLVVPGMATLFPLVCLCGLVMYAFYAQCDPLRLDLLTNRDQLLPYFTVELLGKFYGVPGLFLACLYSGTLSTISSGLNSLAAVVWEDMLKPFYGEKLTDNQATNVTKLIACAFGVVSIGLACCAQFLGGVLQAAMTLLSMLGGPLAGLFLFGMLFPWGNKYGALSGVIGSAGIMTWITVGAQIIKPYRRNLETSILGCTNATLMTAFESSKYYNSSLFEDPSFNSSDIINMFHSKVKDDIQLEGIELLYQMSYKIYGLVAILLVFIIAIPVSLLTQCHEDTDSNAEYVWPGVRYMYRPFLSKSFLAKMDEEDAIKEKTQGKRDAIQEHRSQLKLSQSQSSFGKTPQIQMVQRNKIQTTNGVTNIEIKEMQAVV